MIYLISVVIYAVILGAGLYLIKRHPAKCETVMTKLCLMGFLLQLMVNYLFWGGQMSALNPLAQLFGGERSAVNLMILAIISIFCYASLMVILFKAKDFYES